MARRAGVFRGSHGRGKNLFDETDEDRWHTWARLEQIKRTAYCITALDLIWTTVRGEFTSTALTSQLFLGPPAASDGALDHEAPASDELFAADNAETWAAIRAREGEPASTPFCETARQLFTPSAAAAAVKSMDHTSLGRQALVGACLGVALSTRASRSPNDFAHDRDPSHLIPLARALQTAMLAAPTQLNDDPFSSAVSIQACWIHILADIRLIEISNGRDGLAAMRRASAL